MSELEKKERLDALYRGGKEVLDAQDIEVIERQLGHYALVKLLIADWRRLQALIAC